MKPSKLKVGPEDYETGYVLHSRRVGAPGSFLIRFGTAFWSLFTRDWTASHTAIVIRDNKRAEVWESTFPAGVHAEPIDVWVRKHPDFRVSPIDCEGYRALIHRAAVPLLGKSYEKVCDMWRIPADRKSVTRDKLFCTEFVLRVLHASMWTQQARLEFLDPENTSPEELRRALRSAPLSQKAVG